MGLDPLDLDSRRSQEQTNFSISADVRSIIEGVAADQFEGNRSAALRYVVRDWNRRRHPPFATLGGSPSVRPSGQTAGAAKGKRQQRVAG